MISEDEAERAVDYMRDSARSAAQARAERAYVEEYRKVMKALIMKEHADLPLGAQEREAYSDPRYTRHLEAIRDAVKADEEIRFLRDAADAKWRAWQTQSRNERSGP